MANVLHIVNGDSTAEILRKSSIKGDIVVFRELLCDGPIVNEVGSDNFWKKRYAFFEEEFEVSKLEYFDKTIKELIRIEDNSNYNSVVLWFEFDLFCQVNLMALCSYLIQFYRKNINYYLICTGRTNGSDELKSLSDFSPLDYVNLFDQKDKLTRKDLSFASECWELYVENDIDKLSSFKFNSNRKFLYFQSAIIEHLKRFPEKNGLNQIQTKFLNVINSKSRTEHEIIREMLIWQNAKTIYGFGDLQYFWYLKKLKKYYTILDSKYYLTSEGKSLINQ